MKKIPLTRGVCRKRAGSSSRFRGVCWYARSQKWVAAIRVSGRNKNLGYFFREIEAARAYDCAARLFFGHFAQLNFPEIASETTKNKIKTKSQKK